MPNSTASTITRVKNSNWYSKFLKGLKDCANVSQACDIAGIERTTAYKARYRDPVFAAKWDEVVEYAVDSLEKEAWRRAREGVTRKEPIMYQGKQVAEKVITEHDTQLITFLLRANRPEKYREQVKVITEQETDKAIDQAIQQHSLPAGTIDATDHNT